MNLQKNQKYFFVKSLYVSVFAKTLFSIDVVYIHNLLVIFKKNNTIYNLKLHNTKQS